MCRRLAPAVNYVAADPLIAVRVFDEVADATTWAAADVPGSPYAVALDAGRRRPGEGHVQQPRPTRGDHRHRPTARSGARRCGLIATCPTRSSQHSSRRGFLERARWRGHRSRGAQRRSPRLFFPPTPTPTSIRTSAGTPTRPATARRRPGCRGSIATGIRCARATAFRSTISDGRSTPRGSRSAPTATCCTDADGVPLAPAPRTKVCETAGEDYGIDLRLDGSWYRCCGGTVRRIRDCCGVTNVRINGDAALPGYCYPGRHVFCVTYYETAMPC